MARCVNYIDFGFTSAHEYWTELVLLTYARFQADSSRANAILVSAGAWHVHEWIWHDLNYSQEARGATYTIFKDKLFSACPELCWIHDVADAGKHRGLGRPSVAVQQVVTGTRVVGPLNTWVLNTIPLNTMQTVQTPLVITLSDGSRHAFAAVIAKVIEYWRANHFAS